MRARMTFSRLKLLMMRMPWAVSPMCFMMSAEPSKERRAARRTFFIRRLSMSTPTGAIDRAIRLISGSL